MMYNPQLETFLCVVEAGSFNKTAEALYISPPAVIKQINSLEASLGIQLFEVWSTFHIMELMRLFHIDFRQSKSVKEVHLTETAYEI